MMPTVYKNGQVQGTASTGTYATLYSTSASVTAVISSLVVCNQSSSSITYRIGLMGSAGTPSASEFLVYDATIAGNDTVALTLGISMAASQFIRVSTSASTSSFAAFVSEIS
jgi:hypothetical protein